MTRRESLRLTGAALAAHALRGAGPAGATLDPAIIRLNLKHKWTTVMSSSDYRDTLHLRYTRDGITGHGEGAPIVRYNESAESAKKTIEGLRQYLSETDPAQFSKILKEVFRRVPGQFASKSAIDIALMDWTGQRLGVPLYRYFGLDAKDAPVTTFSIGIDDPKTTKAKGRHARNQRRYERRTSGGRRRRRVFR